MTRLSDSLRGEYALLELHEVLKRPTSILLGVSTEAAAALAGIEIKTVFDLGASWVFANAAAAASAPRLGTPSARFGTAPNDWLKPSAHAASLEEIGTLDIENLRGLTNPQAAALRDALGLSTIRDFANWPPRAVASGLVGTSAGATLDAPELQAEELRPRFGEYPTERVYYETFALLQLNEDPPADELDAPLSLTPGSADPHGFKKPAVGALLTFSQSWYAQGVTLGHLLHCLALAPGEATRIAVIDWSRRTRAATTEAIAESERLDSAASHARALSEVQNAVANEMQSGGSRSASSSTSDSFASASAVGTGLLTSLFASGDTSSNYERASTASLAESSSWSIGNRSVFAGMTQNVNDKTEQHSSSVRNRRASAVREVSQDEHESVSTRIVANYNHMHALTLQYYEVVQVYRVVSQLHRVQRCLFIPIELLDFAGADGPALVDRFRGALLAAALNRRARDLLLDDTTAVAIRSAVQIRAEPFRRDLVHALALEPLLTGPSARKLFPDPITPGRPVEPTESAASAALPPGGRVWSAVDIAAAARIVARSILRPGSNDLHFPDDTEILALSFSNLSVKGVRLDRAGAAADQTFAVPTDSAQVDLPAGTRLLDLDGIHLSKADEAARSGSLTLHLSYLGRRFNSPRIPVELHQGTALQTVVTFLSDQEDRRRELLSHLQANRAYYSNFVFRTLDTAGLTALLARFKWNNASLLEQVEPKPIAVIGNFVVLPAPIEDDAMAGVTEHDRALTWKQLLDARAIGLGERDQRLVPIPTGGVFAEGVLGRSNASEKLDITRFWNWQDSPPPLVPPEIAAISTGSRGEPEDLRPGELGTPVLNIVNPTSLPEPSEIGAVLDAVARANLFRDMSGLSATQRLIEAGTAGTLRAATEAGELASTNLRTEAEKAVAMGQIAGDLAKAAMGVPSAGGTAGISGDGARINHGRDMDDRRVPGPDGAVPGSSDGSPDSRRSALDGASATIADGTSTTRSADTDAPERYSHEAAYADKAVLGVSPSAVDALAEPLSELFGLGSEAKPRALPDRATEAPKALADVASFRARAGGGVWRNLSRAAVADRLARIVNDADAVNQGSIGVCGPAVFFNQWASLDPASFVAYAIDLYEKGSGSIGSLTVKAGDDLRAKDYAALKANMNPVVPAADWMVMSALRDSENFWFDFEGTPAEDFSGGTSGSEVADWLRATGLFRSVSYTTPGFFEDGIDHAKKLNPAAGRRIILFVDTHLIGDGYEKGKSRHFVSLRSPVIVLPTSSIDFTYWTWGSPPETIQQKRGAPLTVATFNDTYVGAIVAIV